MRNITRLISLLFISFLLHNGLANAQTSQQSQVSPLPAKEVQKFSNAIAYIKKTYVSEVDDEKLFNDALSGMLSGLDPHSAYLNKQDYKDLRELTNGEFGGLGIEIIMENGLLRVVAPLDDTPASRAGIKPGDIIIRINDDPVRNMTIRDAVSKMRGKPGTSLTLTIIRKDEDKPMVVNLVREKIQVRSVKSYLIDDGFGYVRISNFQSSTAWDLKKALNSLNKKSGGKLHGLVLDLRNNPGGLLDSSIDVTNLFLDSKKLGKDPLIVYTKGRMPESRFRANATGNDDIKGAPLVVLINGGSASGSEIVAGALQDYHRAVIMGTRSFGKGSVQTVFKLDKDSAIKLTTALYYTPSGRTIQAKGVAPDVIVEDRPVPKESKDEDAFKTLKESDLKDHLNGDDSAAKDKDKKDIKIPTGGASPETDYQLKQALNLLKGLSVAKKHPH